MSTFNIHGGHNTITTGASGYFSEVTEDRNVKNKVIAKLRALGHTVYDCTDEVGKTATACLKNICSKCNEHTVDLDVSIHFNASNGAGHGTEVLVYSTSSVSYNYAKNICNAISELGFSNRGVKVRTDLYFLKHTKNPALLIECCFCDNLTDHMLYNAESMANAIVKGITGQVSTATDNSTPSTGNENSVNYQVKVNTKSGVNCRKEASASSAKITAYANGTVLNISKEQNGWGYANNTGWVSLEYCTKVTGSSSSSNQSWKGDLNYYLNNSAVGVWQNAMNVGFDTNELEVDNKFGAGSQNFAKTHLLWSGQTHNCPTAIKWLQNRLRYYGFNKLSVTGKWSDYLTTCVKTFQKNRGIEADGKVGLVTTYWLLEGTIK